MAQLQYVPILPTDTLAEAFAKRVALSGEKVAYREYDAAAQAWRNCTWSAMAERVGRLRAAFAADGLVTGDRVAIMLRNCCEWIAFDQAAHAQGLIVVPLFVDDRPENMAYILGDAGAKAILVEGEEHLKRLDEVRDRLGGLQRIVTVKATEGRDDPRVMPIDQWLPAQPLREPPVKVDGNALATIVYTSGTTGRSKGVMLSHQNMLQNVKGALAIYEVYLDDVLLSFLPLSHMFERTVGYYLTLVCGAEVAFARSIPQLNEDFRTVRPTVIVSVPRIYERMHAAVNASLADSSWVKRALFAFSHHVGWRRFLHAQGRGGWRPSFLLWPVLKALVADKLLERMGGRLRLCVSGGAALNPEIAHTFLGLGLPIAQGYGLSEASPIVSANTLARNDPASIGAPLPDVEIAFGDNSVLLVKGPNVMLGYWNNPEATAKVLRDGWLDTGDQAKQQGGYLYITGRIKEIIVLGNGEKVPPVDMELAIQLDPLMEQVMVVGEGKPYLAALVVLNPVEWKKAAAAAGLPEVLEGEAREKAEKLVATRAAKLVKGFPGYAQVRRVAIVQDRWTVDNGLLTPTLKLRRREILEKHAGELAALYKGH